MEVSGQLHAPAALHPGKSPGYPCDRKLGGPQSQSGCSRPVSVEEEHERQYVCVTGEGDLFFVELCFICKVLIHHPLSAIGVPTFVAADHDNAQDTCGVTG
jgi:hypothetical protein